MTRQILFIQGGGEDAHDAWDDKLVASLERTLGPGHAVRYPRMPDEAGPHFATWKDAILAEVDALPEGAMLIGHSLGAAILTHSLAQRAQAYKPGGIFLLAMPFIGTGGWPSDEIAADAALGAKLPRGTPVFLYHGDADETVPAAHAALNAAAIPQATLRMLPGRDHQLGNDLSVVADDILALES